MRKRLVVLIFTALCATLLLVGCGAEKEVQQTVSPHKETATQPEMSTATEQEAEQKPEPEPEEPEAETESKTDKPRVLEEIIEENTNFETNNKPLTFEIEDTVIYDEEGVTVTLDKWDISSDDSFSMILSITNNNPDNKKASFEWRPVINGFYATYMHYDISAGESETITLDDYLYDRVKLKELIGTESISTQSLSLYYAVQIGSDGEWTQKHVTYKNPEFTVDDFIRIYGNKIGEFTNDAFETSFEVYLKHTKKHYTLVTLKQVGNPIYSDDCGDVNQSQTLHIYQMSLIINDKVCNASLLYGYGSHYDRLYTDGGIQLFVIDTPENIRKENEIPNDVQLATTLNITLDRGDYFNTEVLSIPIPVE